MHPDYRFSLRTRATEKGKKIVALQRFRWGRLQPPRQQGKAPMSTCFSYSRGVRASVIILSWLEEASHTGQKVGRITQFPNHRKVDFAGFHEESPVNMIHIEDNGHVRSDPHQAFDEDQAPPSRRTLIHDHKVEVVRGVSHELEDSQTAFRSHDLVPKILEKGQEGPGQGSHCLLSEGFSAGWSPMVCFLFLISVDKNRLEVCQTVLCSTYGHSKYRFGSPVRPASAPFGSAAFSFQVLFERTIPGLI